MAVVVSGSAVLDAVGKFVMWLCDVVVMLFTLLVNPLDFLFSAVNGSMEMLKGVSVSSSTGLGSKYGQQD